MKTKLPFWETHNPITMQRPWSKKITLAEREEIKKEKELRASYAKVIEGIRERRRLIKNMEL